YEEAIRARTQLAVLGQHAGDLDRLQKGETIFADVVVGRDLARLPVRLDLAEEIALDWPHHHPRSDGVGPGQTLTLVAMVVRHHHVADPRDAERRKLREHVSVAE